MLNFMVLVGKVKEIPEIRLTAAGTKIATMLLEVDRGFRNSNGEYDQDAVSYTHLDRRRTDNVRRN